MGKVRDVPLEIWTPGSGDPYTSVVGGAILACGTGACDNSTIPPPLAYSVAALCYGPGTTVDASPPSGAVSTTPTGSTGDWIFDGNNNGGPYVPSAVSGVGLSHAKQDTLAVWVQLVQNGAFTAPFERLFKGVSDTGYGSCSAPGLTAGQVGAEADWDEQVVTLQATISGKSGVYRSLPDQIQLRFDPLTGRWESTAGKRVAVQLKKDGKLHWGFRLTDLHSGARAAGKSDCCGGAKPVYLVFRISQPGDGNCGGGGFTVEVTE